MDVKEIPTYSLEALRASAVRKKLLEQAARKKRMPYYYPTNDESSFHHHADGGFEEAATLNTKIKNGYFITREGGDYRVEGDFHHQTNQPEDVEMKIDPRSVKLEIPRHHDSMRGYMFNNNNNVNSGGNGTNMENAIRAHAKILGIEREEYFWIAEEALLADVEYPWVEMFDEKYQQTYFYNEHTQESRWENPVDEHYRDMYQRFISEEPNNLAPIKDQQRQVTRREGRLRQTLQREREHYKERKLAWSHKESRLMRQARKREQALKKERDEWRRKLQALEQSVDDEDTAKILRAEFEKERDELRSQLSKYKKRVATQEMEKKDATQKEEQLVKNLEKVTIVAEAKSRELSLVKHEKNELEKKLDKMKMQIEMLQGKTKDLEEENFALNAQLHQTADSSGIPSEMQELKQDLAEQKSKNDNLEAQMRQVRASFEKQAQHVLDLETVVAKCNRRAHIHVMEKQHLEEELITRRLACHCSCASSGGANLSRDKLLEGNFFNSTLSDTETDRVLNRHGNTMTQYKSKLTELNKKYQSDIKSWKKKCDISNQTGAYLLRTAFSNRKQTK